MAIMGLFSWVMVHILRRPFGYPLFDLSLATAISIGAATGVLARGPRGILRGACWGLAGGLLLVLLIFCIVQM